MTKASGYLRLRLGPYDGSCGFLILSVRYCFAFLTTAGFFTLVFLGLGFWIRIFCILSRVWSFVLDIDASVDTLTNDLSLVGFDLRSFPLMHLPHSS